MKLSPGVLGEARGETPLVYSTLTGVDNSANKEHLNKINMDKESKDKLKGITIVPLGLAIILVPYSLIIGWSGATLILFWFVLAPGLAIYLPTLVSGNKYHLFESITGLMLFYGIMAFMIYDHYKTDYFQLMILSCVINVILVSAIIRTIIQEPETQ